MKKKEFKVVIVGGGVSGFAAAHRFQEARSQGFPVSFTLLEASNQLGGKILTQRIDGFLVEGGPESFVSYKPWGLEICEKLGLTPQLIGTSREDNRVFTLRHGDLQELPRGLLAPARLSSYLTSPALSLKGRIRILGDLILPRKKNMTEDESVASFVRRRLGEEALGRMVEPLLSGIYAGNVEQMSLRSAFPLFFELEQEFRSLILGLLQRRKRLNDQSIGEGKQWTPFVTLREGTGQLIDAWVKYFPAASLVCGKRVEKISSKTSMAFKVFIEGGEIWDADAVILAVSSYQAADLIQSFAPAMATTLQGIPYASTATISLGYRKEDVAHPLNGYGFLVPRLEKRRILAATWTSTKFPHRAPDGHVLIRCFVGGETDSKILSFDDEGIIQIVRNELKDIMGIRNEPVLQKVFRWTKATPQYVVGHQGRLDAIEKHLQDIPGLLLTGAAYRGVGIPDCIHQGTLSAERLMKLWNSNLQLSPQ